MTSKDSQWRVGPVMAFIVGADIVILDQNASEEVQKEFTSKFPDAEKLYLTDDVKVGLEYVGEEDGIGIKVRIQSEELGGWYRLCNFYTHHLGNIILQCNLDHDTGNFYDSFTFLISNERNEVSLVSESMKEYSQYLEEMVRYTRYQENKKAKKWIVGHRYDSLNETRFILAKVCSRTMGDNEYKDTPEKGAWIYTSALRGDEKSVSEVLNDRVFGDKPWNLKIMTQVPKEFVESGEALVVDCDFSDDILENILRESRNTYFQNLYQENENIIHCTIPLLLVRDLTRETFRNYTKDLLECVGYQCLYHLYDQDGKNFFRYGVTRSRCVKSSNSLQSNVASLIDLIFYRIPLTSVYKIQLYESMFQKLGVDTYYTIKELLNKVWNISALKKDFDTYMENKEYFYARQSHYDRHLDFCDENGSGRNLYDVVGRGYLYQLILDILYDNSRRQKSKRKVLGEDGNYKIIDTYKIVRFIEIPELLEKVDPEHLEDLKNEILQHQFYNLTLVYYEGSKIK